MTAEQRLARQVKTATDLSEAHRIADRVLERARAAKSRAKERGQRTPQKAPEPPRKEVVADLRAHAWKRAGGIITWDDERGWVLEGTAKCEVSGVELGAAWELHHLRGGGERRTHESIDNVLAITWEVHRAIHRGDLDTLRAVKEACIRLGLRDGLRAIDHRLAKLDEARAAQGAP